MHALLVSDLHYDLRKFDWVLGRAGSVDLLVVAGDLLDIGSDLPLDAQIAVVLEYLARWAAVVPTVACSGNHDLDHRGPGGEKATGWLAEARATGAHVDGDSVEVGDWLVTACAWWEGPETLGRLEAGLEAAALQRTGRWAWVWHGPPDGPLAWTGRRSYGDPELPRLLERHRPDLVLCGHVHEAPFVEGGAWALRHETTWLLNCGQLPGELPAHAVVDLEAGTAAWASAEGAEELALDGLGRQRAQ